jgi:hypothetical protein
VSHASRCYKLALGAAVALPLLTACAGGGGGGAPGANTTAASASVPDLPIPAGIQVDAPAPGVPPNVAAFSGTWGGYWDGVMPSLLIVERVSASGDAQGIYIWGNVPQWNVTAGQFRFRTKIVGNKLSWGADPKFEFTHSGDGKLHGERIASGQESDILMAKKAQ